MTANQPPARFYQGGPQIAAFRRDGSPGDRVPEDWVASVTQVFGEPTQGESRLDNGMLLSEAIAEDAEWWLGRAHVARYGRDPLLLVKLLDAGQRLPVHAHPSKTFASKVLGSAHGKAEAWYMLTRGVVHLGLNRPMMPAELSDIVRRQDSEALLGAMHRLEVGPGDRIFVPPGTLHAIGQGCFLIEVQEPADLSILTEWDGFDLPNSVSHTQLGLPLEALLAAVDLEPWSSHRMQQMVLGAGSSTSGLPAAAGEFFRLDRLDVNGRTPFAPGFAVVVCLSGAVELCGKSNLVMSRGDIVLCPAGAEMTAVTGEGRVVVARPPRP